MSNVTLLAIDLAKNNFQLHGTDAYGKNIINKKISREKLPQFMANLNPCNVYMEGCSSANYWGRQFKEFGHKVKLINPKYVKPYVKRNKNDKNDSIAIASAARDPEMTFGEVKTEEQQDIQSTHRIRSHLVSQRTSLVNMIRGLLSEYGIVAAKGVDNIRKCLPKILGNNEYDLNHLMLVNLQGLYESLIRLDEQLKKYDNLIEYIFKGSETCKRLEKIPGVGKLGSTILAAALGNGAGFKNGRHFAAFLGLVPKQYSSGNKEKLLGISKGGDTYIRTILIHGARALLTYADKKSDNNSIWLKNLKARSGSNIAAVAMANKIARTAWALVHEDCEYNPSYKPSLCINK
jgi:transposase